MAIVVAMTLPAITAQAADRALQARPNIVWIFVDDMSPNFSCYGEKTIAAPNVDAMAAAGTRFSRAFVTAPVCSACRSALITGMYQTSIGAQNHRSGRGKEKIYLPQGVEPVPLLFRRAGYYTCIGGSPAKQPAMGKTDYNFEWPKSMYEGDDWKDRKPGQPFFMQVQLSGGKHRHAAKWKDFAAKELGSNTKPEEVTLPPYYPRDPVILDDWAQYLDAVRYTDREVKMVLDRLDIEGLADSTVVFFMTDHGISHARGKQFLYDEGIHVPLVIRGPGIAARQLRTDLVQQIDLAATSLALAGIEIPATMQGRNILAADYRPRTEVYAARDRCDETVDHIRCVRTEKFAYIRNFLPQRPHMQPNRYKDGKLIVKRLRELHAEGRLDAVQAQLFAPTRPEEELYDVTSDPYEIRNLAADPAYASTLADLRERLDRWIKSSGDRGNEPESMAMYDSDMAEYAGESGGKKNKKGDRGLADNIKLMKRWAAEGK
ncbi:MAG TPA: sulfatase-like hydrolase/transferase [Pirellulales bacterium]|nr:sulfatase-like hydrolase/transferase [Pirellulales bacterium]